MTILIFSDDINDSPVELYSIESIKSNGISIEIKGTEINETINIASGKCKYFEKVDRIFVNGVLYVERNSNGLFVDYLGNKL